MLLFAKINDIWLFADSEHVTIAELEYQGRLAVCGLFAGISFPDEFSQKTCPYLADAEPFSVVEQRGLQRVREPRAYRCSEHANSDGLDAPGRPFDALGCPSVTPGRPSVALWTSLRGP